MVTTIADGFALIKAGRGDEAFDAFLAGAKESPRCLLGLAYLYERGEGADVNAGLAATLVLQAAQAGDPAAQLSASSICFGGYLGVECDLGKGHDWLRRSVEASYPPALHELGTLHEHAFMEVQRDIKAALQLYTRAAELGFLTSQEHLATLYTFGDERVKPDETLALRWKESTRRGYEQHADQGDVVAQLFLALANFAGGWIVNKRADEREAVRRLTQAVGYKGPRTLLPLMVQLQLRCLESQREGADFTTDLPRARQVLKSLLDEETLINRYGDEAGDPQGAYAIEMPWADG